MVRFSVECELPLARDDFWRVRATARFLRFLVDDGLLHSLAATPVAVGPDGWATRQQSYVPARVDCPAVVRSLVGDTAFGVTDDQRWSDVHAPYEQSFKIRPSFLTGLSRTWGTVVVEDVVVAQQDGDDDDDDEAEHDKERQDDGKVVDNEKAAATAAAAPADAPPPFTETKKDDDDVDDVRNEVDSSVETSVVAVPKTDSKDDGVSENPTRHNGDMLSAMPNRDGRCCNTVASTSSAGRRSSCETEASSAQQPPNGQKDDVFPTTPRATDDPACSFSSTSSFKDSSDSDSAHDEDSDDMPNTPDNRTRSVPIGERCRHVVAGECRVSILTVGWFVERSIVHNLKSFYREYPESVARFRAYLVDEYADGDHTVPMSVVIDRFLEHEASLAGDEVVSAAGRCSDETFSQDDGKLPDIESNASTADDSDSDSALRKIPREDNSGLEATGSPSVAAHA